MNKKLEQEKMDAAEFFRACGNSWEEIWPVVESIYKESKYEKHN